MRNFWMNIVGTALLLLPDAACAADLEKINRTIVKEPAYVSKQPRYCLLAFGPQATMRVWLVVDGDYLYIDRNGNGDLTEPGERVKFAEFRENAEGAIAGERQAEAGVIVEGKLKHESLVVTQKRVRKKFAAKERGEEELQAAVDQTGDDLVYDISLSLEIRPRPGDPIRIAGRISQSAGLDGAGYLQFAARPEKAPVVHFRGPLQMGLHSPQRLLLGDAGGDLMTIVGTPGLGKGTFTSVVYIGLITEGAPPVAEIEFPALDSESFLAPVRYTLSHRC